MYGADALSRCPRRFQINVLFESMLYHCIIPVPNNYCTLPVRAGPHPAPLLPPHGLVKPLEPVDGVGDPVRPTEYHSPGLHLI